ncbi:MAG: glycoside hydrolase family 5 protein [Sedimentisphaerales bacterium]|nr:glycoside hydrolase family 5 protein [Sedimentisphaerales bacterium]
MIMKRSQSIFLFFAVFCSFVLAPINAVYADLPRLHVDGNKIKDPNDTVIVLRGVSMIDLGATEIWYGGAINMIDRITDLNEDRGVSPGWYTKIIRIPICPHDSALFGSSPLTFDPNDPNASGNTTLYTLLRTVVDYCADKDVYAIIDWHHMANTYDELADTNVFWEYMATRFADDSHVLFELFNEPMNSGSTEAQRWDSVRADMQTWVDIVRTYAPNNLILVGTPHYDQILAPVVDNPIADNNVVYVCHLYPCHWLGVYNDPQWYTNQIITCAEVYPVICTEWGFRSGASAFFNGTATNYGRPFKAFLEQYGIGNTAWCASYDWESYIFRSNWHLRCGDGEMGCFAKDWLYEKSGILETPETTAVKCKVKAGKTQYAEQGPDANDVTKIKDNFNASGAYASKPLFLTSMTEMDINIVSANGDAEIYSESIDFTSVDVVNDKYSYSYKIPAGASGAITSLKMNFAVRSFSIKAKNIDLTGLGAPLRLNFSFGNTVLSSEVNETIINGYKKNIPTRLMRLYDDALVVTRGKARSSTKPSSDSLKVKGEIAVADMDLDANEPNLADANTTVTITWGDAAETEVQTFTVQGDSFTASKKGHTYKCRKVIMDVNDSNEGIVTGKFDLDKCTFMLSVKSASGLYTGPDEAQLGINIANTDDTVDDFDGAAEVNLVTGRSY